VRWYPDAERVQVAGNRAVEQLRSVERAEYSIADRGELRACMIAIR
jgi:hypothetical protein